MSSSETDKSSHKHSNPQGMDKTHSKSSPARMIVIGAILIILTGLTVLLIIHKQNRVLANETGLHIKAMNDGPMIKVISAGFSTPNTDLVLLGEAVPFQAATLYSKTSGYVEKILVDKGDKVKQGQLLASVISPETDQAYNSAVADLENKRKIAAREKVLVGKDYVSKQESETAETDVTTAEANVKSLKAQQDYKNIRAPFSGTITARYVDEGALVQNATNSQTSALPVVAIATIDALRIYVYVEQKDASNLKTGNPVTITLTERADVKIDAKITRMADALDPKTRMMLVEIDIPNQDSKIVAGSYVQVHIHKNAGERLQIPSEALIVQGKKYTIAVIGKDSILHYRTVNILNNDGINASVTGIEKGDIIGLNVGQSITDGQKVRFRM